MHIGMRTVKTAVGTAAAMLIAYELHLEYWTAAGIITILSVQNTTKASFRLVAYRLLATVLGFVIAIGAFLVLGYNALAFGLFLLIFIPLTNVFAVQSGIVMTAVLVTHFMMAKSCSWFWIKNELLLLVVGAGVALIANLFMPSLEAKITEFQAQVEAEMREILDHMSQQLGPDHIKSADNWANLSDLKMTLDAAVAWLIAIVTINCWPITIIFKPILKCATINMSCSGKCKTALTVSKLLWNKQPLSAMPWR